GLMRHLATRGVNELLLESGPTLCGAMLQADLIDELVLYLAPCLMGDGARAMFNLPALQDIGQRVKLEIRDIRAVGGDWRFICRVKSRDQD
ncbi:MAG: RibD family protein, partial [Acidiferrobacterales bacterium]